MLVLVRQGDKYGPEYVEILKKQAKETSGLETLVLGDGEDADIPLKYGWQGWWSKLELFRPDIPKPFIYIDLDSYVLGDISRLLGETMICREWHPNIKGCGMYQSSVIAVAEQRDDIWNEWMKRPEMWMRELRGDQNFLEKFLWNCIQDHFPDYVGSYKFHNIEEPTTRVVTFHGKPLAKDAEGWAKDLWHKLL